MDTHAKKTAIIGSRRENRCTIPFKGLHSRVSITPLDLILLYRQIANPNYTRGTSEIGTMVSDRSKRGRRTISLRILSRVSSRRLRSNNFHRTRAQRCAFAHGLGIADSVLNPLVGMSRQVPADLEPIFSLPPPCVPRFPSPSLSVD